MYLKVLDKLLGFDSDHKLVFAELKLKELLICKCEFDTTVACNVDRDRKLLHFSSGSS